MDATRASDRASADAHRLAQIEAWAWSMTKIASACVRIQRLSRKELVMQPHVVIVGGGIGGLFAANALTAHGLAVSVYEQASALGEIGAGVFLTPNSVRHLQRVGLEPAVEKWGARVGHDSHYFRHDGAPIAPVQVTDSSGWNATFGMHRADLVAMLASALPAGVVQTGHRCTGFEQDGIMARLSFADGARAEGDAVIAADG